MKRAANTSIVRLEQAMHHCWAARKAYKRLNAGRRYLRYSTIDAVPARSPFVRNDVESSFPPRRALVCVACATRAPPWKTLAAQFITYQTRNSVQSTGTTSLDTRRRKSEQQGTQTSTYTGAPILDPT